MKTTFLTFLICFLAINAFAQNPWTIKDNKVILDQPIHFEVNTANLTAASKKELNVIASYLSAKTYITKLRIEGHLSCDLHPSESQLLSEQRALAVAKYLVTLGVDCDRLLPVGFGDSMPIVDESTPEGKAQNERIEFANAELKGLAIGGMPIDGGGNIAGDPCKK